MEQNYTFLKYLKNRELNELYASISIRTFAISLVGIFIPVYLYQLGYSFAQIFFFYAIASLVHAALTLPAGKLCARYGVKHVMLISMPLLAIFLLLINFIDTIHLPIWVAGIFLGTTSLFWTAYHIDFSKFSDYKTGGMQVSFSKILATVFAIVGPAIGGFILALFGFHVLFVLVFILLIGSTYPLFMSKEVHDPIHVSISKFFTGQKLRDIIAFMGYGIESSLGGVVWPLFVFIFIINEQYITLGLISSLAFSFALVATFLAGKFSDMKGKHLVLKVGSFVTAIVWIVKSFIRTPLQVFVADSVYGASQTTATVPFDAINYEKAKERNITGMILQREFYFHTGIFLMFLFLSIFADSINFRHVFRWLGPIASLMKLIF